MKLIVYLGHVGKKTLFLYLCYVVQNGFEVDVGHFNQQIMIILITGASHTGKTLLSQRLLEKYSFPYISIDHMKMGLIRSGNTSLTPEDDDSLTAYLWPVVREMVKTAIENRQNLIVEGCYIPSDWRNDFNEEYLKMIRLICLAMADKYVDSHFDKIISYASAIETRLDDSCCTVDSVKKDNAEFIRQFAGNDDEFVLIEDDYEMVIDGIVEKCGEIIDCKINRGEMKFQSTEDQIEYLLEKPYWIIDVLPEKVSAERARQYFAVEDFYCDRQFISHLYQRFAHLIIKLSCYFDVDGNPTPKNIYDSVADCTTRGYANFLFADEDVLVTLNGGDLYMTVYNPNERFLQLLRSIVASEGLFLRES